MSITKKLTLLTITTLFVAGMFFAAKPAEARFFDWFMVSQKQEAAAIKAAQELKKQEVKKEFAPAPAVKVAPSPNIKSTSVSQPAVFTVKQEPAVFEPVKIEENDSRSFIQRIFGAKDDSSSASNKNINPEENPFPVDIKGNSGPFNPNPDPINVAWENPFGEGVGGDCYHETYGWGTILDANNCEFAGGVVGYNPSLVVPGGSGTDPLPTFPEFDPISVAWQNPFGEGVGGDCYDATYGWGTIIDGNHCQFAGGVVGYNPSLVVPGGSGTDPLPTLPTYEFNKQVIDSPAVFEPVGESSIPWYEQKMRRGDRGSNVRDLQYFLKGMGYYDGPLDGVFGKGTQGALIKLHRLEEPKQFLTTGNVFGSKTSKKVKDILGVSDGRPQQQDDTPLPQPIRPGQSENVDPEPEEEVVGGIGCDLNFTYIPNAGYVPLEEAAIFETYRFRLTNTSSVTDCLISEASMTIQYEPEENNFLSNLQLYSRGSIVAPVSGTVYVPGENVAFTGIEVEIPAGESQEFSIYGSVGNLTPGNRMQSKLDSVKGNGETVDFLYVWQEL
jgi:hypothetical protein